MTELELIQVPVPQKTDTYSPVSHQVIINQIEKNLHNRGLFVSDRFYNTNKKGTQVVGLFDIQSNVGQRSDFSYRLAFRNSYDKSMSVAFVGGASVMVCSNGMIFGEVKFIRRHTGTVLSELKEKITDVINDFSFVMDKAKKDSTRMKSIMLDKTAIAELCGRFFMEQDIITSSQLNIIRDQLKNPDFEEFKDDSLWSLYNHTTYALKKNHPIDYIDRHQRLHSFVEKEFNLV